MVFKIQIFNSLILCQWCIHPITYWNWRVVHTDAILIILTIWGCSAGMGMVLGLAHPGSSITTVKRCCLAMIFIVNDITKYMYIFRKWPSCLRLIGKNYSDNKVHGTNMGPIWGRQGPGGPHVGPMNLAIWVAASKLLLKYHWFKENRNHPFFLTKNQDEVGIVFRCLPLWFDHGFM